MIAFNVFLGLCRIGVISFDHNQLVHDAYVIEQFSWNYALMNGWNLKSETFCFNQDEVNAIWAKAASADSLV